MGHIFLVRHAQASFGSDDYDRLSELGVRQAQLLGQWMASCEIPVDHVMAGAMRRHRETAEHCLNQVDARHIAELQADARLNEFDHAEVIDVYRQSARGSLDGDGEGVSGAHVSSLSSAQLQQLYARAMERWMSGAHAGDYRESWSAFSGRCLDAFEAIASGSHGAKSIMVFTSGGVIAAICQGLLDLTDKVACELNWSLANTGVTRVLFTQGRRGLGCLNSTAHFDQARAPQMLTYR
ncbi:histidine phosphatase family protein [Trinickia terrae]|uniref:Histidine phosphatase family protein n=1 Tax=Trinickia terrae TaxID=2571161 RepID=A0A4U1I278_9BURK|nr:histidine phosphatase family protein [Trinickia terrae]TKC87294.1 histidine phosphatase family protein [Trinickia terrae]